MLQTTLKVGSSRMILLLVFALAAMQNISADSDMADSLDFEAFHQSNAEPGKLREKPYKGPVEKPPSAPSHQVRAAYTTDAASFAGVLPALISDMDMQCPAGWQKIRERSTRENNVRYLHFDFICL